MPVKDVGSWNAMISGFCQNGNAAGALSVLNSMKVEGVKMDTVTVSSILPVCAQSDDIVNGLLIHLHVLKHGLDADVFVSNALINMYSKFGRLQDAQRVFDDMEVRDLVSWNSIIAAYEQNNDPNNALRFFKGMQLVGIRPDLLTVVSLTSIFAQLSDQRFSRSIHGFVIRREWLEKDVVIGNTLVNMYAKLGDMNCAHTVFDQLPRKDTISWNTLITGYAQNGLASEAIDAYNMMEECRNIIPNQGTWVSIIPAYSHVGALQQGMKIHGRLIKNSLYLDVFVATCLIDMAIALLKIGYSVDDLYAYLNRSLLVMRGNSADMARHVMCPSPNKRVSITFFRGREDSYQGQSTNPPTTTSVMTLWQPDTASPFALPNGAPSGYEAMDMMLPSHGEFLVLRWGNPENSQGIFHRVLTKDELWHYLPLLSHEHKTLLLNPPLLLKDRNIPEVAKFKRQCIKNLLELEILFKDTIASDHGKWTITKATSEDIEFFYSKVKKKG
ncbi:hypothetical protein TSUD_329760 [Trifolium subterraneum]|nr:hypothetical protein TSUD_329760 [Trifolium subterraneum]